MGYATLKPLSERDRI